MNNKKIILSPAKLNIFLKVLGRRKDGYHEIRTGVSFINLFDHIEIEKNHKTTISYSGLFKPDKGYYSDCIIKRTIDFLDLKDKLNLKINIVKNIPVQGGLGSASTNAASLIKTFEKMNLIKKRNSDYYAQLGADIPCFIFGKDCLVSGMGEKLTYQVFPKYFFLLIKPKMNNSTKDMFKYLRFNRDIEKSQIANKIEISDEDTGNDFENIAKNKDQEFDKIFNFIENIDQVIFSRMTGSGSCCFAVFEKKKYALQAKESFMLKFPDIWSLVCENNFMNN